MQKLRRLVVAAVAAALLAGGPALASTPEDDPTCGNPGGAASGQDCAGDNGDRGCEGIGEAGNYTPGEADGALDLVTDILSPGEEGDCGSE